MIVSIHPLAERELREAVDWYREMVY